MNNQRSHQPEWIDLGPDYYTSKEYRECLYQLDRIGRFLGGDRATYWAFDQLKYSLTSILDVGCGGGLFTARLAKRFPQAQITGIDISQEAIQIAKEHLQHSSLYNIEYMIPDTPHLNYPVNQFDVVTATLVCHHLTDQDLISFIQKACQTAKHAVILNDLHRHPLATAGFALATPLFFRNRLIWHDGLLSIQRSFKRSEWRHYLAAAGIDQDYYTITWHWAFRWIVIIHTTEMKK